MPYNTTPAALVELREQFDQCRSVGKRAVFPDELKQQAVALLDEFSPSIILQALRLSPTSLSRWKNQLLKHDNNPTFNCKTLLNENASPFISLPAVESGASSKYPLTVVLGRTGSDEKVTLNGEITMQQWQEVLISVSKVILP